MKGTAKQKQKPMSNLWFKLMALEYRSRSKPLFVVDELRLAGVSAGMHVLDFGCGPGRYAVHAASIVGAEGMVYALDIHPLAIQMVEKAARKQRLTNIRPICSSCTTGLEPETIDLALLFNTLHDVDDRDGVLAEIRRVLKPNGRLVYRDHTLNGASLLELMNRVGFCLVEESEVRSFAKCLQR
jgi:ubiquinone/menaquinone biosynthesis C-methylase UbiE